MNRNVELLAPAGTFENLRYACAYGADAVYAGLPRYSLRVRNNDFKNAERIKLGIDYAHNMGKLFFLAVNTLPHGAKTKTFLQDMEPVISLKPDALIMADPGLIILIREKWPDIPVHLSVQANTLNSASVKFWQKQGISRVILSRELSIQEIKEIRQECPDIELEVFIHGALCVAYSGRCLLSGYFNHRDANQGSCTNACRWNYGLTDTKTTPEGELIPQFIETDSVYNIEDGLIIPETLRSAEEGGFQRHPDADKSYLMQEMARRQGEWMEISEDENGTYIMNSKDLRAVQHVHKLIEIGVNSLKIEGRTKSYYYVARTAQIYRQAIDDALAGQEFNPELYGKLECLANRGYTDGFLQRHVPQSYQNYLTSSSHNSRQQFVAQVKDYDEQTGLSRLEVRNRFMNGDRIEIINPQGNRDLVLQNMTDRKGNPVEIAKGAGYEVFADIGKTDEMTMIARYFE